MPSLAVTIALFGVFFLVIEPLLVLAHELGHAVLPLARGHTVTIVLGGPEGERYRAGRLTIIVAWRELLSPATYGLARWGEGAGRATGIVALLAGPAVSASLFLIAVALAGALGGLAGELLEIAAIYLLLQTAMTLLPIVYPSFMGPWAGTKSDGMGALELLLGRETPGTWPGADLALSD